MLLLLELLLLLLLPLFLPPFLWWLQQWQQQKQQQQLQQQQHLYLNEKFILIQFVLLLIHFVCLNIFLVNFARGCTRAPDFDKPLVHAMRTKRLKCTFVDAMSTTTST